MPRHERLRQPDLRDELRHGRFAMGEPADDPEAIDVGERLVDEAQLTQLVGLENGVRDRAANVGARGAQSGTPCGLGTVASTAVYINRR
jgi:hypothetical protein